MMKRILAALMLALLATVILLPNAACRRMVKEAATGIPSLENVQNLDVLL